MRCDAALMGRVNCENASIRTAFHVSVHSTNALIDGPLEDFGFPAVEEGGVEAVPGSIAVGEHKRLLGVESLLSMGIELGGVPVNLHLDLGEGHRVRGVCAPSVGCVGNVGLVVIGINILRWGSGQWMVMQVKKRRTFPSQQLGNICRM